MSLLLEIRQLCAFYGRTQVLFGLDLEVAEGGVTTLLGANGAGKTTTLRAVSGMLHTTGEIRFAGERISGRAIEDIVRLGIAHVPEGRQVFASLSVLENLEMGAYAVRGRPDWGRNLDRIFTLFPVLAERRRQMAGTLSGGEQQMLAVGRALMLRPKLMLLDEPSFGLAPLIVRELFEIFRVLNRDEKVSMLLVEQNASLALDFADQVYLMETGRLVMTGAAQELRRDETIRRSYLGY